MTADRAITLLLVLGAIAALVGGGAAIWGYLNEPQAFFPAWLAGFYFWLSMPLGALALLLIWDLTGGRWEPLARLPLTAMAATAPLFILLFLPVIAGMHTLYPWTRAPVAAKLHNLWYLNDAFFYLRAGVYFLIWNGFAAWRLLRRPGPEGGAPAGMQWLSGVGVLLMGYSLTFAGIDWIMSTEPDWFSSIYGMVVGSGQFIASLSCALVLIVLGMRANVAGVLAPAIGGGTGGGASLASGTRAPDFSAAGRSSDTAAAAGSLEPRDRFEPALASLAAILLAVVVFWAYTSFCQWLIIWEENLHAEIHWFLERWGGAWSAVVYAVAAAHFFLPFFVLVWSPTKRNPAVVGAVCGVLLVADLVNVWWLLLPGFRGTGFTWLDPLVMLCIGGLWLLAVSGAMRFFRDRIARGEERRHA